MVTAQIMIIDDEPIVGRRLHQALTKSGYQVETFLTGAEALKRLEEKAFDLVVTDIRMDEIDGMDVLNHITEKHPEIPVVIITGYATIELARQALARGAFDFIAKPFKPDELREVVRRALEERNKTE